MTTVSFKLSNDLESRIVEATQFKYKYPQNIPVIVEKTIDSDVPEIDKNMYLVPAELTVGQFLPELNLGAQRLVFVFVKNTLAPTGALVSDLYDKHKDESGFLYMTYSGEDILCTAKTSLRIANSLMQENGALEALPHTWMPLLSTLAKLASVSESNQELKLRFEEVLRIWTEAFCKLLLCFATTDDISWIIELKDHTNFDVRNHMMQSLFPYPEQEQLLEEDLLQVVVSRTNLLQESMSHVMAAQKWDFSAGIHVSFKDEQAEGDGVLREWLYLVCNRLFDPQRKLFTPSPNDSRRFSPHPEPLLEENYLQNYRFAGRMVTLALKHNLQVGILFDPLFFLQLSGKVFFSLEDLIQTDMELHKQYKRILEMDGEELDAANGFDLTFSGIWADGDNKPLTSDNRHNYISLNIHERYYHKVRDQVVAFSDGVEDLIEEGVKAAEFFSLLKLDDLDSMMYGAQEDNIDVDEWRQYTDYTNYTPYDNVILWFWKVLYQMEQEDLHKLLCFWTSHKFLPKDGFRGLPRLSILRMITGPGLERYYKPKSQTCFYSLHLPAYNTYGETEEAVRFITKDYIFSGFGDA